MHASYQINVNESWTSTVLFVLTIEPWLYSVIPVEGVASILTNPFCMLKFMISLIVFIFFLCLQTNICLHLYDYDITMISLGIIPQLTVTLQLPCMT